MVQGEWDSLAERAQSGDAAARRELAEAWAGILVRFFEKHVSGEDWGNAEDLAQETLLRLFRELNRGRYDPSRSFYTWAFTFARRVLIDEYRRCAREPKHMYLIDVFTIPESRALDHEFMHALQQCLDEVIATELRDAIRRYYWESQTLQQIAAALGMRYGALKGRLDRARGELRKCMERKGIEKL